MPGRREGWAEGLVGKAQEAEKRIMGGEEEVEGGVMARRVGVWRGQEDRGWEGLAGSEE